MLNYETQISVALDWTIFRWYTNRIRDYRKNGYNVIDKPIGRPRKKTITKRNQKKIKELEEELLYLRAENAYLKALRELTIKDQKKQK